MNLDLIVKLVKLANNNPNENEANLAARKVCTLIAQGNYQFNGVKTAQSKIHVKSNPTSNDWVHKYYDEGPRDVIWKDLEDLFNTVFKDRPYEPYRPYSNRNQDPIFDEGRDKAPKKEKVKVDLKCTVCHRMVNTAFVGPSQMFVCTVCVWEKYMKDKNGI